MGYFLCRRTNLRNQFISYAIRRFFSQSTGIVIQEDIVLTRPKHTFSRMFSCFAKKHPTLLWKGIDISNERSIPFEWNHYTFPMKNYNKFGQLLCRTTFLRLKKATLRNMFLVNWWDWGRQGEASGCWKVFVRKGYKLAPFDVYLHSYKWGSSAIRRQAGSSSSSALFRWS